MTDEPIDIYNENGHYLGIVMKSEAHAQKWWHKTFHCWIYLIDEKENLCVLLQKRSPLKKEYPGFLSISVGGHLQSGEKMRDGVREIKEELGIEAPFEKMIHLFDCKDQSATEFISVYGYHYKGDIKNCILQESEVDSLFYAKIQDINDLFCNRIPKLSIKAYQTGETHFAAISDFVDYPASYYIESMKKIEDIFLHRKLVHSINYETPEQFKELFQASEFAADEPMWSLGDNTLIHIAAYNKQLFHLKILIDSLSPAQRRNALNKPNRQGMTPLHECCSIEPSGMEYKNDNPTATELDIEEAQKRFERQCALMPTIMDYLIEQGADSFFEKGTIQDKKSVNIIDFLNSVTSRMINENKGDVQEQAWFKTKRIVQSRINAKKSLFELSVREGRD